MSLNRDKEVIIVRVYILCEKSSVFFYHYIVTCLGRGIDFIVDIGGGGVKRGVSVVRISFHFSVNCEHESCKAMY